MNTQRQVCPLRPRSHFNPVRAVLSHFGNEQFSKMRQNNATAVLKGLSTTKRMPVTDEPRGGFSRVQYSEFYTISWVCRGITMVLPFIAYHEIPTHAIAWPRIPPHGVDGARHTMSGTMATPRYPPRHSMAAPRHVMATATPPQCPRYLGYGSTPHTYAENVSTCAGVSILGFSQGIHRGKRIQRRM